ncbi:hypothetical protein BGZ57DRAFT_80228 [Hyaloscypha finlandica]|nr:hypothetical protein BGZ57DRAFT_80228 [Hyaloscypha finlandica]
MPRLAQLSSLWGVGCSTSRAWIVPCLWCLVWARSILWVVLNSWRGITLGQNVRPLARIGACRALQGLMWGRAESRGGTEQPISCQRECRWHDSLRRDETRRFICPRLHLSMPRPRCPALSLRSVSLVHEANRPRKSKSRCRTPYNTHLLHQHRRSVPQTRASKGSAATSAPIKPTQFRSSALPLDEMAGRGSRRNHFATVTR